MTVIGIESILNNVPKKTFLPPQCLLGFSLLPFVQWEAVSEVVSWAGREPTVAALLSQQVGWLQFLQLLLQLQGLPVTAWPVRAQ